MRGCVQCYTQIYGATYLYSTGMSSGIEERTSWGMTYRGNISLNSVPVWDLRYYQVNI